MEELLLSLLLLLLTVVLSLPILCLLLFIPTTNWRIVSGPRMSGKVSALPAADHAGCGALPTLLTPPPQNGIIVSDPRMSMVELLLSVLLILLAVLLSQPNLRLLHSILTTKKQPNVFDRALALCLATSGGWTEGRILCLNVCTSR